MPVKTKKVYLVLGSGLYGKLFSGHGRVIMHDPFRPVSSSLVNKADVVIFTGGNDVNPSMYSDPKVLKSTSYNVNRDHFDVKAYNYAITAGKKMVGICRGAQFLNVMNGGSLFQDVSNHSEARGHTMFCKLPRDNSMYCLQVTSTHHQMMRPAGDFDLLGWSENLSDYYEGGDSLLLHPSEYIAEGTTVKKEPEVVWFPNTDCLAVQYHPEYMKSDSLGYYYFQDLLEEYIL